MGEVNEVGERMNPNPRDRLLLFPVLEDLYDFRAVLADRAVAFITGLHGRYTRHRGPRGGRVAIKTCHLVVARMDAVAEGNRLHRPWRLGPPQEKQTGNRHRYHQQGDQIRFGEPFQLR